MDHDKTVTGASWEVMECDGGEDMDHAEHVHIDRNISVRVVSADVGPAVEQTGTKNEVGM